MNGLDVCEDEIYVTCVCGELINEKAMVQHIEDCLKEDFIKNATSLKISKPRNCGEPVVKARHVFGKCIRCSHLMYKDEGTVITFYPSIPDSVIMCCSYKNKCCDQQEMLKESTCKMCKLPNDFHEDKKANNNRIVNCIENIEINVNSTSENKTEEKYRQKQAVISNFLENLPDNSTNSEDAPEHNHTVISSEISTRGPTCKLFHVALLPNYNRDDEGPNYHSYSLFLQILDSFPRGTSVATQTDLLNTMEFGVQVKILGVYPEEVQKLLATGKDDYNIPDFDPVSEAAYRSHLSTLIPCKHCSRTFSPDRVQKHMSCCIERPRSRTRECKTPTGGEISR